MGCSNRWTLPTNKSNKKANQPNHSSKNFLKIQRKKMRISPKSGKNYNRKKNKKNPKEMTTQAKNLLKNKLLTTWDYNRNSLNQ